MLAVHCALYVAFEAGIVAGTAGDQLVQVYPSFVTSGAVKLVP